MRDAFFDGFREFDSYRGDCDVTIAMSVPALASALRILTGLDRLLRSRHASGVSWDVAGPVQPEHFWADFGDNTVTFLVSATRRSHVTLCPRKVSQHKQASAKLDFGTLRLRQAYTVLDLLACTAAVAPPAKK
jgi:hypothetical protein